MRTIERNAHAVGDVVTRSEIARRAQVRLATLQCWTVCFPDFPTPRPSDTGEPVWSWDEVEAWLHATGREADDSLSRQ